MIILVKYEGLFWLSQLLAMIPGGAEQSTNDRDEYFEQTLSFVQDWILYTSTLNNSYFKKMW